MVVLTPAPMTYEHPHKSKGGLKLLIHVPLECNTNGIRVSVLGENFELAGSNGSLHRKPPYCERTGAWRAFRVVRAEYCAAS